MKFTNLNILTFSLFLIVIVFIIYIFYRFFKNQNEINKKYPGIAKGKYFYIKYIFLFLSFLVLFLSIFGIKVSSNEKNKVSGIDIVFILDVSKSMNVADIFYGNYNYTRLQFAKKAIGDFISKNTKNRYSLVIFSGEAVSTIPLTSDYDVFLTLLENLDYRNLTKQGSDFYEAFNLGNNRFYNLEDRAKVIVFLSDGADKDANLDLKNLYKKDIFYFIAGVGTEKGGRIITGKNPFGEISYQKYNGKYVISKLNEKNLKNITSTFKSSYKKLSNFSDLQYFNKEINNLEKKSIEILSNTNFIDFSRFLTFISFLFFMIFFVIYIFEEK